MRHTGLATLGALLALSLFPAASLPQDAEEGGAGDAPYSRKGADTCLSCHDEDQKVLALFSGKHAVPGDNHGPFGAGQLQCEACHGPGGNHAGRVRRGEERPAIMSFEAHDATPAKTQNGMCLSCHGAETGGLWHGGTHEANGVTCAGCHTVHAPSDAVLRASTQSELCFGCHVQQSIEARKPYAHPLHEGKMACSSCHNPHGTSADHNLVRATVNETCNQCHAEKRGPFLWEHAPVAEDCTTCHAAHGASQPGMLTRRAPLLCQSCHSQAGHPSIAQGADGQASGTPSQYLLGNSCMNCHNQVHGSNHPSGSKLMR